MLVLVKWVRGQGKWTGCSEWRLLGKRGTTGRAGRMAEMASPCSEPRNLVLRETQMTERGLPWLGTLRQWGTEPARPGLLELFLEPRVIMGHFIPHSKPLLFVKSSYNLFESLKQRQSSPGSCTRLCVPISHLLKEWMLRKALGEQRWGEHSCPCGFTAQWQVPKVKHKS